VILLLIDLVKIAKIRFKRGWSALKAQTSKTTGKVLWQMIWIRLKKSEFEMVFCHFAGK
jgi:hypothetical protein